jgi:hypothetical protein
MKIEVKTTILETGKILQEINQDKIKQFYKVLYDTKEAQFREALIRLGWTPPPLKDNEAVTKESSMLPEEENTDAEKNEIEK